MRTIVVLTTVAVLGLGSAAFAQQAPNGGFTSSRAVATNQRVQQQTDGRCGGISYGTGARSCGTATGGPVGGLSSRN